MTTGRGILAGARPLLALASGLVLKQRSLLFHGVEDGRFKSVRSAPPLIVQDWN